MNYDVNNNGYWFSKEQLDKHDAKIRADATEELPTLLYYDGFNDGYVKGIADAIDEIFEKIYDVDMDSSLIYLRFDKDKFNVPFMTRKCELKEWFKEQLKSRISTVKGA